MPTTSRYTTSWLAQRPDRANSCIAYLASSPSARALMPSFDAVKLPFTVDLVR
jgi:hypothetical protein